MDAAKSWMSEYVWALAPETPSAEKAKVIAKASEDEIVQRSHGHDFSIHHSSLGFAHQSSSNRNRWNHAATMLTSSPAPFLSFAERSAAPSGIQKTKDDFALVSYPPSHRGVRSVRRFSRLDHRLPKFARSMDSNGRVVNVQNFACTKGRTEDVATDFRLNSKPNDEITYSAATRRCTTRKYPATNTSKKPLTANTSGAV